MKLKVDILYDRGQNIVSLIFYKLEKIISIYNFYTFHEKSLLHINYFINSKNKKMLRTKESKLLFKDQMAKTIFIDFENQKFPEQENL